MVVSDRPVTLSTPEGEGKPGVGLTLSYTPPNHVLCNFKLFAENPIAEAKGVRWVGSRKVGF